MFARLVHGSPLMADYTPVAAVSAGDVIVAGDNIRIAHGDIPAGRLGAYALPNGSAVYAGAKTAADAIADGAKVYWDVSEQSFTDTATDNIFAGRAVGAAAADDEVVYFQHTSA